MNGEHKEEIPPQVALKTILERLISNLDSWAINTKILIVFHRGLQNIKVNRKIYRELKEKEHLLHPFSSKAKDAASNYNIRQYTEISKAYSSYIKLYLNVAVKTDILTKVMKNISAEVQKLETRQILKNQDYFESLMKRIFDFFSTQATFCRQTRLFSNVIFMLFKDMIKVYKVYYVHTTEILERFANLGFEDAQKAFKMYQAFVELTSQMKPKASKLIYEFNFPI